MKTTLALTLMLALAPLLAAAENISYIGDSQSASAGALYSNLSSTLSNFGTVASGAAVCGATIDNYLASHPISGTCKYNGVTNLQIQNGKARFASGSGQTQNLDGLMADSNAVVVELGDNHLKNPRGAAVAAQKMAQKILSAGKQCVWIGPASIGPSSKGVDRCKAQRQQKLAVSQAIKGALAKTLVNGHTCTFIDSFSLTKSNPPPGDDPLCIHYFGHYPIWTKAIQKSLAQALSNSTTSHSPNSNTRQGGLLDNDSTDANQ